MDDNLRLDGNAAAGPLGEVFAFEMTLSEFACNECGTTGELGAAMVYEVRDLGTIVRCPNCDNPLIRLSHHGGRYFLDMRGLRLLVMREASRR